MCGLCKLNAAALDTTVACGYNGIDQHNLGLLPPLRGLIFSLQDLQIFLSLLPPSRGLIRTTKSEITLIQLLPPLRGLIRLSQQLRCACKLLPPIAGIDICLCYHLFHFDAIAPSIAGIDTPCRERSAAQRRRPFHTLPSTFHTLTLRSPPHLPFR